MRPKWASLEEIKKEIRECARERQDFTRVSGLVENLFALQDQVAASVPCLEGETIRQAFKEGTIVMSDFKVASEGVNGHLEAVIDLLDKGDSRLVPDPEVLKEYVLANLDEITGELPADPHKCAGRIQEELGISIDVAQFLLWAVFHPFFRTAARQVLGDGDTHLWSQGFCPICGARPHMGQLRDKDGARVLECWLCGTQWNYPRILCPFCQNEKQDTLGFFYLEGNEGFRVQVCDECKKYLKVIDARKVNREVVLSVQNLATLQYDAVAEGEGYQPGSGLRLVPTIREDGERTERGENS